jgi:chromosome segregation ATPase
MKNFLQNLLIFLSFCLCVLIAFQWTRETQLRKDVQGLTDTIHDRSESIQALEHNLKQTSDEVKRLDDIKTKLTQTLKSNDVQLLSLNKEVDKTKGELDRCQAQVDAYKVAVERANDNIKAQNENIKKQNEEMLRLAEERNVVVSNFNKVAKDYNELADRWNKQQEELAAIAATNAAATAKGGQGAKPQGQGK